MSQHIFTELLLHARQFSRCVDGIQQRKKKGKKSEHKDPFPQGRPMNVFMEELEETMLYLIDYGGHLSGKAENIRSNSIQIT